MQFSTYTSPIPLFLRGKFHPEILSGYPSRGVKQGRVGENALITRLMALRLLHSTID